MMDVRMCHEVRALNVDIVKRQEMAQDGDSEKHFLKEACLVEQTRK